MNALLARYLDGELSSAEAVEFLEALDRDSALEAELREHERLMALSAQLPSSRAPEGFTASVMDRLRSAEGNASVATLPWFRRREATWLAAAASMVLFFGLGWQVADPGKQSGEATSPTLTEEEAAGVGVMPASWVAGLEGAEDLVAVRFVYPASRPDLRSVTVAGSFNEWNPSEIPLHREGALWTAVVVLPRRSHEYMFIEDGQRWVADPTAVVTRDDGFGGRNAVLDLRI